MRWHNNKRAQVKNVGENSRVPASASKSVPKTGHFCRKMELNALPCNFPSESDCARPKKAILGFNIVWIQMEKEDGWTNTRDFNSSNKKKPASILAATILPGASADAHFHGEAGKMIR